MYITNRINITFEMPEEAKEAEKFRKEHPEATEAYTTNFHSFIITNMYTVKLATKTAP